MSTKQWRLIFSFCIVFAFTSFVQCTKPKAGTECRIRQYNFTAINKDSSGKRCRDKIQSSGCFGACETLEYGTAEFPHKAGVQTACVYEKTVEKVAELKFCEPGASDEAKTYTYKDAISCKCDKCDPSTTNCISGFEMKRRKKEDEEEREDSKYLHWEDIQNALMP